MEPSRLPCPQCREPISGEAAICPHCRSSALVDVLVDQPVSDPKARYRAARALLALGPDAPPLSGSQAALEKAGGRLLAGVRLGLAAAAAAILEPLGIRTRQVAAASALTPAASPASRDPAPRRTGPQGSARSWLPWAGLAAAVVLAGGGVVALRGRGQPVTAPREGVAAPTAAIATVAGDGTRLSGRELAEAGLRSTVALHCDDSLGSGFFVAPDTILTNAHVVCAGGTVGIKTSDGREVNGIAIRKDERLDLALIRMAGLAGVPLPLGDSGTVRVGDRVVVVGSPAGLEFSVSQGSIANVDRPWLGLAYLQTDTAINPGNSGGPMLDETGQVVGVVSMKKMDAEGIGLVLPINYAYTGVDAFLQAPGPASDSFGQRADRAEELDRKDAQKLAATGQRPGIMGAQLAGALIQLQIVWPQAADPGPQTFNLNLLHKEQAVCALKAAVTQWQKVEKEGGGSVLPGQMKSWLERHGFSSDFYFTVVLVNFDHCTADAVSHQGLILEMEGADPAAARVRFQ